MQKEQLLNLLDQQARSAFEGAKRIALDRGGLVTPLHIVFSVLQSTIKENHEKELDKELTSLLQSVGDILDARYPGASESITVSKETQTSISEASRLAQLDGFERATPAHLLRAALGSQTVKEALDEVTGFVQMAEEVTAKPAQSSAAGRQSDDEPSTQTPSWTRDAAR